jgi:hypothetical protein
LTNFPSILKWVVDYLLFCFHPLFVRFGLVCHSRLWEYWAIFSAHLRHEKNASVYKYCVYFIKEKRKKEKKGPFTPWPNFSLVVHGNYILNIGCHYIWPGLIALPKNTLLLPGYLFCFILIS